MTLIELVSVSWMVLALDVALEIRGIEVDFAQVAGAVTLCLVVEVR